MEKRVIIIKMENEKVSFNPHTCVPISNTNIPIHSLKFRTNEQIYWLVELEKYSGEDKTLTVKVVDYIPKDVSIFNDQSAKNEIEKIIFSDKFDWDHLEPQLTSYTKSNLSSFIFNSDKREQERMKGLKSLRFSNFLGKGSQFQPIPPTSAYPTISKTFKAAFSVNFRDSKIESGFISFKKKITGLDKQLHFEIVNSNLRPEFDNIKSWFSKKLKKKRFAVSAEIKVSNGLIEEIIASSKDIEQINSEMIDSIKYVSTMSIARKSNNSEKGLLTIKEIFCQESDNGTQGNIFNLTEEEILNLLVQRKGIRNKKQLEYLSGAKQSGQHPMRYTLHPQFGFLFFSEGEKHNHFVWELLDSHATYLWSIEKKGLDISDQFKRMEIIINTIRKHGRESYKNAYRNFVQDSDILFNLIQHKDANSKSTNEFSFWKDKVDEYLNQ